MPSVGTKLGSILVNLSGQFWPMPLRQLTSAGRVFSGQIFILFMEFLTPVSVRCIELYFWIRTTGNGNSQIMFALLVRRKNRMDPTQNIHNLFTHAVFIGLHVEYKLVLARARVCMWLYVCVVV